MSDHQPPEAVPSWEEIVEQHSDRVYRSISLFNEHTWGASNPWTDGDEGMHSGEQQWHWKYAHGVNAQDDAATFTDHASARLGEVLPESGDAVVTYYATNTTALARTATVRLFVRESRVPLDRTIEVRDGLVVNPAILSFQDRSAEHPHPVRTGATPPQAGPGSPTAAGAGSSSRR